jgi:hypothetical protein
MISIKIPKISQYKKILHQHKQLSFIIYHHERKQLLPNIFQYKKKSNIINTSNYSHHLPNQRKKLFLIIYHHQCKQLLFKITFQYFPTSKSLSYHFI